MECREIQDLMSDYLEQELPEKEESMVKEHIAECATCRAELSELADTIAMVHKLPSREPAIDLWEDFAPRFAEICAEMRPGLWGRIWLYFSEIISSVREGWEIFTTTVRYSFDGDNVCEL